MNEEATKCEAREGDGATHPGLRHLSSGQICVLSIPLNNHHPNSSRFVLGDHHITMALFALTIIIIKSSQ